MRYLSRWLIAAIRLAFVTPLIGCFLPTETSGPAKPQTVVLLATPKMIPDFNNPDKAITDFLGNYKRLTAHAAETIVIFAVGNSDHILYYNGPAAWNRNVEWARTTDFVPVSDRTLTYTQIHNIVLAFKNAAAKTGVPLKVYDQIESGNEFTISNIFKYSDHAECTANKWQMFDVGAKMLADTRSYASAPTGIVAGTLCGKFLVDQVARYMTDVGFDGILYGNQLGTRGRWYEGDGPGYSDAEAATIKQFFDYSKMSYGARDVMWFDSYNTTAVEKSTFSFPAGGYDDFNYIIASGFCVIQEPHIYAVNLESKLKIKGGPKILATIDYVDPWYQYNSMINFPDCTKNLEDVAVGYRDKIDGVMFFANDELGRPIPRGLIDHFARRFFGPEWPARRR